MSPEEFRVRVAAIIERAGTDYEVLHSEFDDLCANVLRDAGYGAGLDLLDGIHLWYA